MAPGAQSLVADSGTRRGLDLNLEVLAPLSKPASRARCGARTRKRRALTESRTRRLPMGRRPAFEEVESVGGGPSTHRPCERGAQNLLSSPYPSARCAKHQSSGMKRASA